MWTPSLAPRGARLQMAAVALALVTVLISPAAAGAATLPGSDAGTSSSGAGTSSSGAGTSSSEAGTSSRATAADLLQPVPGSAVQAPAPAAERAPAADDLTGRQASGPSYGPFALAGMALLVLVSLALTGVAMTTLWWMLHAWRTPQALAATRFAKHPLSPSLSFSLLVPARHEEEVLGETLDTLARMDHPDYEVLAIIGHDDPGTELVARQAALRHPDRVRVVIDHSVVKNKPRGLNTALPHCRGEVVGVFDAEDEVHPRLLRLVDSRFQETSADVVQGGVQLMNHDTSWWALRNVLEYYFWFRSRLHFHAEAKFIPLGGNTVFIRTELLRENDGWDADCLAEDCEIGVRLSTQGRTVVVGYDAEVVTREETPGSLPSLFKQRTRWNQGFLQVLRKGEWRALPTRRQRWFARYLLSMPFLQAATGLFIPVAVALIFLVKVPTVVALISFLPIAPTIVTLAAECAALQEFGATYGRRIRVRDYVRLILGTFPYQIVLAGAAIRAVVRELRGQRGWEKTAHANVHRPAAVPAPRGATAATHSAPVGVVMEGRS